MTVAPAPVRSGDTGCAAGMTRGAEPEDMLVALDPETATLVRLAAALAGGDEAQVEAALTAAFGGGSGGEAGGAPSGAVRVVWVEELLLQTYLFAGFPRALNGMLAWRRVSGVAAPQVDVASRRQDEWRMEGGRTCGVVYGAQYDRLRAHVRALHPALDEWMLEEGYGKVLSRAALDLPRRELCIVAACAATRQWRQLRAHLRGARNAGVPAPVVAAALQALVSVVPDEVVAEAAGLWQQVSGQVRGG